jgi:hypothetical protein
VTLKLTGTTAENAPLALTAELIHTFQREEMPHATEAPTFRNMALAIFNRLPASRVLLVRSRSTLFFIIEVGGHWFDVTGQQVKVRRELEPL